MYWAITFFTFQTMKENESKSDKLMLSLVLLLPFLTIKIMLFSSGGRDIFEDLQAVLKLYGDAFPIEISRPPIEILRPNRDLAPFPTNTKRP